MNHHILTITDQQTADIFENTRIAKWSSLIRDILRIRTFYPHETLLFMIVYPFLILGSEIAHYPRYLYFSFTNESVREMDIIHLCARELLHSII